jgi:hypothetical protein
LEIVRNKIGQLIEKIGNYQLAALMVLNGMLFVSLLGNETSFETHLGEVKEEVLIDFFRRDS